MEPYREEIDQLSDHKHAIPSLPAPIDATVIGPWTDDEGLAPDEPGPRRFRRFDVHSRRVGHTVTVNVTGEQFSDGNVVRLVDINGDIDLAAQEARELAEALIDAAERAERGVHRD